MGDKCNCYRFSPRDSLSGAVAQIADYLSKHPGWNETELRTFVDGLISSAGVETFNGRSGNVKLNKDDVNNLLIANCYFAEADETIESIDVLALYKLGIRIVFTQYSSEIGGYTLAYGIEYYPTTDTAKAYLFSSGSGGGVAVVSVNGKTGTVILKASDILMNNGDSVENAVSNAKTIANAAYSPDNPPPYPVNSVNSKTGSVMLKVVDVSNGDSVDDNVYIFIDETENYPDIIAPDSNKLGGQIPSYYATAESVNSLKSDKLDKTATAADASKLGGQQPSYYATAESVSNISYNNAGAHNSIYRGKNLGSAVTAAQWEEIGAGTFGDMFVGDYWYINSIYWRIGGFNYWYNYGDTACSKPHVLIVPDQNLLNADGSTTHWMNATNTTSGAYVGSDFYTGNNGNTGKAQCRSMAQSAFGSAHILTHREYLQNAVTNGYESGGAWYDSDVEIMNEKMVYGCEIFSNQTSGTNIPAKCTIDNAQIPLFALDHSRICNRANWWLRGVVPGSNFAFVGYDGIANYAGASNLWIGVRPAFAICA